MMATRCPDCSFDPTSLNDYCAKHRPAMTPPHPETSAGRQTTETVLKWLAQMQQEIRAEDHAGWGNTLDDVIAHVATHATRLQQMREALQEYGEHDTDCRYARWEHAGAPEPALPCTCGLDAALAASPEEETRWSQTTNDFQDNL